MNNRFFYASLLIIFCAFLLTACPGSRQTNVSVNSTNTESGKSEAPKTSGQTETNQTPSNTNSKKADDSKMTAGDSSKTVSDDKFENRCGWFANPTPGNAWLNDKDGEWLVGAQGGYQAVGDWGDFPDESQFIKTNGNYGYGCACMKVTVDSKEKKILKINSWTAKPLSACRNDPALKEPKN